MKHLRLLGPILAFAMVFSFPTTALERALDPFSIKTAASVAAEAAVRECALSVAGGEVLELSADDLELRMGLPRGAMGGITVTALPDPSKGSLCLDGVAVEVYEQLTREEVDRLCFVPTEIASAASITVVPNGSSVPANLQISVLSQPNMPPEIEGIRLETLKNMAVGGYLPVIDPEEDSVSIRLVQGPSKGEVRFSGQSFTYEPFHNATGMDQFIVCAVDSAGNLSQQAVVSISIEGGRDAFTYADMAGHPSLYAAVKLRERGVMSGRQVGEAWFFGPHDQLNRGDFLVMVLTAAKMQTDPTVNTGLPDDAGLPMWLKPYVKKAVEEGIIPSTQPFRYREIPIRAEAVQMVDRAAKISDVKDYRLMMEDRDTIPEWAHKAYRDLAAYRMLDLHDGKAYPNHALTNSYAADLIWQLYKNRNRQG